MRALTVVPGKADSLDLIELPEPVAGDGELLVDAIAIGVCGTDKEIAAGEYGWAPDGHERLVIGHESLGRVRAAPAGSEFAAGDLVVGVVRRPDPVPCGACAHGQFDMCRNGQYTERGIKQIDGYGRDVWTVESDYAVRLDPALADVGMLLEPTTVVAKAWDEIEKIGARSWFEPTSVLVTGAGPIGLLAALLGVQRGLDVHVLDQVSDGPKPRLVHDLGATYHHDSIDRVTARINPDVVIEATGVGSLVFGAMTGTAPYGIVCLTGVSSAGHTLQVDAGSVNRSIVLENDVVVGSVNANLKHYADAARDLANADHDWLARLISRRVPVVDFRDAFTARPDDVKVVIAFD